MVVKLLVLCYISVTSVATLSRCVPPDGYMSEPEFTAGLLGYLSPKPGGKVRLTSPGIRAAYFEALLKASRLRWKESWTSAFDTRLSVI